MKPDFRLLYRKDLLVAYLASLYPADKSKFKHWTKKRLQAAICNISKAREAV